MAAPVRILILDRNRYRSHLTERTISEIVPSPMIARFNLGTEVVRELLTTHHDIAILNLEGVERPVDMARAVRLARPDIKLIVVGLPETPKRVVAAMQSLADSFLCDRNAMLSESLGRAIEAAFELSSGVTRQPVAIDQPVLVR